jgi:hypothetical protein
MHKKMSSFNYAEHEEDEDEKYEEDVQKEEERTCLAEAIHSILDTRPELTLAWAESVRKILHSTDLSSPNPSSSSSSNDASSDPCCHTLGPWRHDQHQDRIVAGLEGLILFFREILPLFRSLCVHIVIKDQSHRRQHTIIKTHCCLQGLETSKS